MAGLGRPWELPSPARTGGHDGLVYNGVSGNLPRLGEACFNARAVGRKAIVDHMCKTECKI